MTAGDARLPKAAGNLVVDGRTGRTASWADLVAEPWSSPTAAVVTSGIEALPFVAGHATYGGELLVVAAGRLDDALAGELAADGFDLVLEGTRKPAPQGRPANAERVWLLTSGTTGRPKRVAHTLTSLATVTEPQQPRRWLCPYSSGTYAWWQLVTLSLTQAGQDLVLVDPADLDGWAEAALEHGVTAVSGTPTFWRQSLLGSRATLARLPLRQVTLGGEPVDQAVLDDLRSVFPQARLSWIYASSEVGASIVVHDGRAGFPASWLDTPRPGRPLLSVVGEELLVTSPHHGEGQGGAVRTGDRVTVRDGRVHVVGRLDGDEINVGGAKLSASAVRDVLQAHPHVAWARVTGRRAPVVGRVVVADVVLTTPVDGSVEQWLSAWCREQLPPYAVPRMFRVLDGIPAKETLKSDV